METGKNELTDIYKLLLIGDCSVGKSTFITRHLTGKWNPKYKQTQGVNIQNLKFHTNYGWINFEVRDIGAVEKYNPDLGSLYQKADGAIIFFDLNRPLTYRNLDPWRQSVLQVAPDIPIVLCGNKFDCQDRKIKPEKNQQTS